MREWLRDPKNRTRYLDDLVWLIHDRFGIVCSTTTMSKMKRKWLRVIDFEENGTPIDDMTRAQLMETHPDLPVLQQAAPAPADMGAPIKTNGNIDSSLDAQLNLPDASFAADDQNNAYPEPSTFSEVQSTYPTEPLQPSLSNHLQQLQQQQQTYEDFEASLGAQQLSPSYGQNQQETSLEQLSALTRADDIGNYGLPTSQ